MDKFEPGVDLSVTKCDQCGIKLIFHCFRMRRLRWITEIISQYTLNYDGTSYSDFSHGFTFNFSAPSDGPSRKSAGGTLMGGTMTNFTDMMAYEGSGSYVDEMEARMWQNIENRMAVMEQNIGAKVSCKCKMILSVIDHLDKFCIFGCWFDLVQ